MLQATVLPPNAYKKAGQKVQIGELPFNDWLKPPNAPNYEENYKLHCGL